MTKAAEAPRGMPRSALIASMVLAVVFVTALAYYDAERESAQSFDDTAVEQATLAAGVAAGLGPELAVARGGEALAHVRAIERPDELRFFLVRPDGTIENSAGARVTS